MPYPSMLPDREGLARLIRRHRRETCPIRGCTGRRHTYGEIAVAFGVHKSAVYQAMRRAGLTREGSRQDHRDTIPWTLRLEHRYEWPAEALRLLGRVRRGDNEIPEVKHRMLMRWLTELAERGKVVTYDPEHGWEYVPREWGDADVIRPPEGSIPEVYTEPDEQEIWGMTELPASRRRKLIGELQRKRQGVKITEQEPRADQPQRRDQDLN